METMVYKIVDATILYHITYILRGFLSFPYDINFIKMYLKNHIGIYVICITCIFFYFTFTTRLIFLNLLSYFSKALEIWPFFPFEDPLAKTWDNVFDNHCHHTENISPIVSAKALRVGFVCFETSNFSKSDIL